MLREFITRAVLGRIAASLPAADAKLRATLAGSRLVGLAMVRYVVRVEPLASADHDTIVAAVAPTIQRYHAGRSLPGRTTACSALRRAAKAAGSSCCFQTSTASPASCSAARVHAHP